MGLIGGTLPVVFKNANQGGFKAKYFIAILPAFALALVIGFIRSGLPAAETGSLVNPGYLFLALTGLIAGVCSMVPGMSISLILIIMGVYNFLLHAAKSIDIPVIAVVGGCFVAGMLAFSKVTKFIFDRFYNWAYFVVFGFMTGSIIDIYVGLPENDPNFSWFLGIMMLLAGLFISLLFFLLGRRFNKVSLSDAVTGLDEAMSSADEERKDE